MAASTRKNTEVWLIGQPLDSSFTGCRYPTIVQMLRRFLFHHENETVRQSAKLTVEEARPFWENAECPCNRPSMQLHIHHSLYNRYISLTKHKNRQGERYGEKREAFRSSLDKTYDLTTMNATEIMEERIRNARNGKEKAAMEEDLQFYQQQMESRAGCIASIDTDAVEKERKMEKIAERKQELKRKLETEKAKTKENFRSVKWTDCDSDNEWGDHDEADDKDFHVPDNSEKMKVKTDVCSGSLLSSLDRNKLRDRRATRNIHETAEALGHDPSKLTLSRSTIRRRRMENRNAAQENFNKYFTPHGPILLYWDGKILQDEQGKKIDRLPVVVKDLTTGEDQLLGVAALEHGTERAQANAVSDLVRARNCDQQVVGTSLDTTRTNTGQNTGACVLLEESFGRRLLNLACRHHVLELPLKAGFDALMPPSTSPEIQLFDRFAKFWPEANQCNYITAVQLQVIRRIPDADEIIRFCNEQLTQEKQPRDDYAHLLQYTVIFLGGVPPGGIKFYKPGCVSRVRFMSKGLYCLLISMFSRQVALTEAEKTAALEVSVYIVVAHIRPWTLANVAAAAPRLDFQMLHTLAHEITRHKKNDSRKLMWQTAGNKFLNHLWYLSPELVSLSLFDTAVTQEEKAAIKAAIESKPVDEDDDLPRKAFLLKLDASVKRLQLCDFATGGSLQFFKCLGVEAEFLSKDPVDWEEDSNYKMIKGIVGNIPSTNDAAERGVALAKEFNCVLTKNEDQKQGLYLVVAKDRKDVKQK